MNLHEAIRQVLFESKTPLTPVRIAIEINERKLYERSDREPLRSTQVSARIRQSGDLFVNINGQIVLADDVRWKELLSSYTYLINILRGVYSQSDLQFIVAALFLYRRLSDAGVEYFPKFSAKFFRKYGIKHSLTPDDILDWFKSVSDLDHRNDFRLGVFSDLTSLLRNLEGSKLHEVLTIIDRVDTRTFSVEEFGLAFEYILEVVLTTSTKSGLVRTPSHIVELMTEILNPNKGKVYDPVCGTGSLLSSLVRKNGSLIQIKGTEINHRVAQLGYMNLIMSGSGDPDIQSKNCFQEFNSGEKFDYVIGDLPLSGIPYDPFSYELISDFGIELPKSGKGFSAIVLFIISKLTSRGKAVLTVSDSFLSVGGLDERVRRLLVDQDLIEAVVSLPSGSLKPYTSGKASLLILNKAKPSYLLNNIKFIDVKESDFSSRGANFDIEEVVQLYRDKVLVGENSVVISNSEVFNRNTLQAHYYTESFEVDNLLQEGNAVRLGDLVQITSGMNLVHKEDVNDYEGVPYIKIENLERDILDIYLSTEKIQYFIRDTFRYARSCFNVETLLIARIGDHLKPTYFKPSDRILSIVTHSGVFGMHPLNNHEFSLEYLYYQLYSPFVQKQIDLRRGGSAMPFISIKALREIVIPFMPLSAQEAFVSSQKSNIIATEREKVNQRLKAIGFEEEGIQIETNVVRTLVHELRPKLSGLFSFSEKLKRIIVKNKIEEFTEYDTEQSQNIDLNSIEIAERPENYTIKQVSDKLLNDSKELSDVLDSVKDVMGFSLKVQDFENLDFYSFLLDYFEAKRIEIANKFTYDIKGTHVQIELHRDSIKQVLNQLIINASDHGFTKANVQYKMQFNLREDKERQVAIIEYSNNGEPFLMKQIDYINMFSKKKGSRGSGIGGNYIYRVIKAHKGDLVIREGQKRGFSITFEIPLKQNAYE